MWYIHELRYSNKVIGYRLSDRSGKISCDFNISLLSYLFEKYLKYVIIELGFELECSIVDGLYISDRDRYMNPIEVNSEGDLDSFILGNRVCIFESVVLKSLLIYRYLICSEKLLEINIPLGLISKVEVNPKMHSNWGYCFRRYGYKRFDIQLAERLMLSAQGYDGIDLVVLHELLHTCPDCMNHGTKWKSWASIVCNRYGYNIKRLSSASEVTSDPVELIKLGYKACQCESCGQVIVKKTECEFIKHPERWSCKCGGRFNRIS